MLHIRDLTVAPPGGWTYTQPETGMFIKGSSLRELAGRVAQHRDANGIPSEGDLAAELQEDICGRMDDVTRKFYCRDTELPPPKGSVNWRDVVSFLGKMVEWAKGGFQWVDPQEADRRASICITCPYNVPVSGCGVCRQTVESMTKELGERHTAHDAGLLACGVCGCSNKVQVHFPLDALKVEAGKYPKRCWKAS